jgi:hypothetical protein
MNYHLFCWAGSAVLIVIGVILSWVAYRLMRGALEDMGKVRPRAKRPRPSRTRRPPKPPRHLAGVRH